MIESNERATREHELMRRKYFSKKKGFIYPNRPLFTMIAGALFLGLAFSGLMTPIYALWLGVTIMVDDLITTPLLRIYKGSNNIKLGRKIPKSKWSIAAVIFGYALGLGLGILTLIYFPSVLALVPIFRSVYHTSLVVVFSAATIAILASKIFKLNPWIWVWVALAVVPHLHLQALVSYSVDVIATALLLGAFFGAVISKYVLGLYYKMRYGHGNIDGYDFNIADKVSYEDMRQAKIFQKYGYQYVTPEMIKEMRVALQKLHLSVKSRTSFLSDLFGFRQPFTMAIKDIRHLLCHAKNQEDVGNFFLLLEDVDVNKSVQKELVEQYSRWGMPGLFQASIDSELIRSHSGDSSFAKTMLKLDVLANSHPNTPKGRRLEDNLHAKFVMGAATICDKGGKDSKAAINRYRAAFQSMHPYRELQHTSASKLKNVGGFSANEFQGST